MYMLIQESGHDTQLPGGLQRSHGHQDTQEKENRSQIDIRQQLGNTEFLGLMHVQLAIHQIRIEPKDHQSQQDAQKRRQVRHHLEDRHQRQGKHADHKDHPT